MGAEPTRCRRQYQYEKRLVVGRGASITGQQIFVRAPHGCGLGTQRTTEQCGCRIWAQRRRHCEPAVEIRHKPDPRFGLLLRTQPSAKRGTELYLAYAQLGTESYRGRLHWGSHQEEPDLQLYSVRALEQPSAHNEFLHAANCLGEA